MLDHLFGSKTRVALLKLFYKNPNQAYFVRELTREINAQINSVRRELENLSKMGIVKVLEDVPEQKVPEWEEAPPKGLNRKKFFQLNNTFVLFEELSNLFSKSHLMLEKDLMNKLLTLPNIFFLVMTGFFTGVDKDSTASDFSTDILIVGNVAREKLAEMIQQFEISMGRDVNYTIMSLKEFEYRRDITDKFLYDILVNPKLILIDKVGIEGPDEEAEEKK